MPQTITTFQPAVGKKSRRRSTSSSLSSITQLAFLASSCLISDLPQIIQAEPHSTIPRSNNRYTHYSTNNGDHRSYEDSQSLFGVVSRDIFEWCWCCWERGGCEVSEACVDSWGDSHWGTSTLHNHGLLLPSMLPGLSRLWQVITIEQLEPRHVTSIFHGGDLQKHLRCEQPAVRMILDKLSLYVIYESSNQSGSNDWCLIDQVWIVRWQYQQKWWRVITSYVWKSTEVSFGRAAQYPLGELQSELEVWTIRRRPQDTAEERWNVCPDRGFTPVRRGKWIIARRSPSRLLDQVRMRVFLLFVSLCSSVIFPTDILIDYLNWLLFEPSCVQWTSGQQKLSCMWRKDCVGLGTVFVTVAIVFRLTLSCP